MPSPSPANPRGPAPLPPIPAFLLALAPTQLPNWRQVRYSGDNVFVAIEVLAGRDQELLRKLYAVLNELLYAIADTKLDDAGRWREIALWTQRRNLGVLIGEVRELGVASHEPGGTEALAKAMHDVRGGALSALLGRLQLLDRLPRDENHLKTLFVLARDHLKIMRNAVVGLDEPRRNADRTPKSHDMRLMLEKWHDSIVGPKWQEQPIRMTIDCRYTGALTECCLESAAIDRIFYNLANNACRHAVGDQLDMVVFPVPDQDGDCLRFVLSNEVSEQDAAFLNSLAQPDGADSGHPGAGGGLSTLFEPEVTSTGSGFGLTVVAEFVAGAFGLRDSGEALRERYLGAILDGHTFRIWFHWPAANGRLPPKLDDFRHPEQSLSDA